MAADCRVASLAGRFSAIAMQLHGFVIANPEDIGRRLLEGSILFTGSVWAIRRISLMNRLGLNATQLQRLAKCLKWRSLEPSEDQFGPYAETFHPTTSLLVRSFQLIPDQMIHSDSSDFLPIAEAEGRSDHPPSDHGPPSVRSLTFKAIPSSVTPAPRLSSVRAFTFKATPSLVINWAAKIEIYLIGVSLKSIQSHGLRFGKSGISIGDITSIFE
jgi:hypothetical protein